MRVRIISILALVALVIKLPGQATAGHTSDMSFGVRVGTLGVGVELSKLLTSHVGLRAGGDFFSLNLKGKKQSNITYDGKLKVQAFSGLLDFYPAARGAFHLTGGVITNPAKVTATGVSAGGNYTINRNSYTSAQVGTLTATGQFGSVEPYVGVGFGTAAAKHAGLSVTLDIGVAIGKPTIGLTATGASSNAQLQSDLNAQIQTTQADLHKVPGYPVLALGLNYRF